MMKNGILTFLFAFCRRRPDVSGIYEARPFAGADGCCHRHGIRTDPARRVYAAGGVHVQLFRHLQPACQISMGTAPEDDYLVHFDPQDKRLARMMMDSHKLVGWCLIATGALIAYEQIIMNTLGDILWRWGQKLRYGGPSIW